MALTTLLERKLVIVTGKGGVGKTTVTAALARAVAATGRRVLCAEIVPHPDSPSQLRDVFGSAPPTEEPRRVSDNVDVVLLTPTMGHRRFLQDTLPIKLLADAAMRSQGLKRFLSAAPGFSDMGVMYRALDLMSRPTWSIMLLDSPATGHALALAQIPEFLLRIIPGGPIGRVAANGLKILTDPQQTAALVVTLPETLPVTEALELAKGLEKHRVPVSGLVVNRVPPDPFSAPEREALKKLVSNGNGTLLGARELKRIERSDAALQLIAMRSTQPVSQLHELDLRGPQLIEKIADELGVMFRRPQA
jgi:arsenite-transporting ATPase